MTPTDADVAPVEDVVNDGDWPHGYYSPDDADIEESHPEHWQQAHRPPEPEQDTFAGRFTAPLTIDPRTTPVKPGRIRMAPILAGGGRRARRWARGLAVLAVLGRRRDVQHRVDAADDHREAG